MESSGVEEDIISNGGVSWESDAMFMILTVGEKFSFVLLLDV